MTGPGRNRHALVHVYKSESRIRRVTVVLVACQTKGDPFKAWRLQISPAGVAAVTTIALACVPSTAATVVSAKVSGTCTGRASTIDAVQTARLGRDAVTVHQHAFRKRRFLVRQYGTRRGLCNHLLE